MMKKFGAIDPGKTGCFVVLNEDGEIVRWSNTPLIGKEYDKKQMISILLSDDLKSSDCEFIILEDVHATQMGGKVSNFDFGRGKGLWEMALMALEIRHELVTPKKWQKEVWTAARS